MSDNLDSKSTHLICTLAHGKIKDATQIVLNDLKAKLTSRIQDQFSILQSREVPVVRPAIRDFIYPEPIEHFPMVSPAKQIMLKLLEQSYIPTELPQKRKGRRGIVQPLDKKFVVATPNSLTIIPVTRITDQIEGRVFHIHDQKTADMLIDMLVKRFTNRNTGTIMNFIVHGDLGWIMKLINAVHSHDELVDQNLDSVILISGGFHFKLACFRSFYALFPDLIRVSAKLNQKHMDTGKNYRVIFIVRVF